MRATALLLLTAAVAAADATPRGRHVPLVALTYAEEGGKTVLRVVGFTPSGSVTFRRTLGEARMFASDADDARLVVTDEVLDAIVCLDRRSGRELWRAKRDIPAGQWANVKVLGRRVFVSAYEHETRVYDTATGRLERRFDGAGWLEDSEDRRLVLLHDYKGRQTHAIDVATLNTLWTQPTGNRDSVQLVGNRVVHKADRVSLRDARTFKSIRDLPVDVPGDSWIEARQIGDALLVSVSRRALYRFSSSGTVQWTTELSGDETWWGQSESHVVLYRYRNPQEARVHDLRTGARSWSSEIRPATWSVRSANHTYSGSVVLEVADTTLWLVNSQELRAHDLAGGALRATVRPDGAIRHLAHDRGRLLVLTERSIQAFEAKSGRALWSQPLEGTVAGGNFIVR